jgi:hypothetical protein
MSISDLVEASKQRWRSAPPPADEAVIGAMAAAAGMDLPLDYLDFFRSADGGEGDLAVPPGRFHIWPVERMLALNREYGVQRFLPGFLGIGTDGGDNLLAFDTRTQPPWPVVMLPRIPLDASKAVQVAQNFTELVACMGTPCNGTAENQEESDGGFLMASIKGAVAFSAIGLAVWILTVLVFGYNLHFRRFAPCEYSIVLCGVLAGVGAIRGVSDRGVPTMLVAAAVGAAMIALGGSLTSLIDPRLPDWALAMYSVLGVATGGLIGYAPLD